jgi:hypothetical protein
MAASKCLLGLLAVALLTDVALALSLLHGMLLDRDCPNGKRLTAKYVFSQNAIDFTFDGPVPQIEAVNSENIVVFVPGVTSLRPMRGTCSLTTHAQSLL